MKITFLGTGAGEGYPGLWCRCPHCDYARRHGGKNVRTNSCALVDDGLMIDISHGGFDMAARMGLDLSQATSLLITHPHEDHVYPKHLLWRRTDEKNIGLPYANQISLGGPRFTEVPPLKMFGNRFTKEMLERYFVSNYEQKYTSFEELGIEFHTVAEDAAFETDGYVIQPVRGNHVKTGFSHGYIISKEDKTLLYALDSGMYDDDMIELLMSRRYDLIVMEGTTGLNDQHGGHMSLEGNKKMLDLFRRNGCMKEDCRFVLTHMSPHWCPPHDFYAGMVALEGMELAWDGRVLTF